MRTTRHTPPDTATPPLAHPFDAIPQVPADVEQRHDSRGLLHLRRRRALRPLQQRLANWLGQVAYHTLELDEHGTRFVQLADGTHSLRDIADALAAASQRPRPEVDAGVVVFTKRLMTLHLLELKIPAPDPVAAPSTDSTT